MEGNKDWGSGVWGKYVGMYDDDGGSEGKEGGNRQTSLTSLRVAEPSNSCSVPTNQDGRSNNEKELTCQNFVHTRTEEVPIFSIFWKSGIIITQLPQLDIVQTLHSAMHIQFGAGHGWLLDRAWAAAPTWPKHQLVLLQCQ